MKRLAKPEGLTINFTPSEKQLKVWNALQPNFCDHCGQTGLELRHTRDDEYGNPIHEAVCTHCGNINISENILLGGAAGGGKATILTSEICTPLGFKMLADIKEGDIITSVSGKTQRVVCLHPIEKHPYYRIYFIDGTSTDCSEGHLWYAHQSGKSNNYKNWTTKEIYEWHEKKKAGMYKGRNLIIPLCGPVEFVEQPIVGELKVDPYIIGAMIGDGYMKSSKQGDVVLFTTMDKEIVEQFEADSFDMSYNKERDGNSARQYKIYSSRLAYALRKLGLSDKTSIDLFIPECLKLSSIKSRIRLMQGLMDTDGYVDDRGHMSYTTISAQLADDVAFVIRSLGGVATIKRGKAGYKDADGNFIRCNDDYTVYFRTKMNPDLCCLTRKKSRARYDFNGGNSELGKRIVDIEYLGIREGRCITVSDDSGLYLVDNFTVTHNSYLGCAWLASSCFRFDGIRMAVARLTLKSLRETTWSTLYRLLISWGLKENIHFVINNQFGYLDFWNGSRIQMVELSPSLKDPDYNSLGSLEITGAFIDEVSEISEKAATVLASRIRFMVADTFVVGKIAMSTNPCQTWVRSTYVQDDDGNRVRLPRGYRYIPFTVFDNPDEKFRMVYFNRLRKIKDKATRERLTYGNWDFIDSNKMAAYWNFNGEVHLVTNLKEQKYNPMKPLVISMDFNVSPYMSGLPIQFNYEERCVYVFPEYVGRPDVKQNNTPSFSEMLARSILRDRHIGGIVLTGDPAGAARSTQTRDGVNNFTIMRDILAAQNINSRTELFSKQPAHVTRLEFVNEIFDGYDGWRILIDLRCRRLTEDLVYQRKNPDGTKEKKKVMLESGDKAEKYGHMSDCLDYALTYFLSDSYSKYKNGKSEPVITTIGDDDVMYNQFSY